MDAGAVVTGGLLCFIFVGIPVLVFRGVHRDKRRQQSGSWGQPLKYKLRRMLCRA